MKLKLTIFIVLILLVFSSQTFSQVGTNAIIRGQLLKSNGKPRAYTEIELVPKDSNNVVVDPHLVAISSTSGKFTFFDVPNGEYTLSINFNEKPTELSPYSTFFYPNTIKRSEAEVFTVKDRKLIKTITFQLPTALSQISVSGKVVNSEGLGMNGIYVNLRDVLFDDLLSFSTQTDKLGNFKLKGFESRRYQISAILLARELKSFETPQLVAAATSDFFVLSSKTTDFKLVLKEIDPLDSTQNRTIGKLISESGSLVK